MSETAHIEAKTREPAPEGDGRADFDFLFGRWDVTHRRLKERLTGDARWETFPGTTEAWPILGGLGNMDDNRLELPGGAYGAATIRQFDPAAREWSIWWMDARHPGLETPVHGRFADGGGTFFAEDSLRGEPIRVRFVWSDITAVSARWEQAFSDDDGANWEVNWTMTFSRRP